MVKRIHKSVILFIVSAFFASAAISSYAAEPIIVDSQQNFEKTVGSIKGAIKKKGLAIIFEANHKNMIEMVGGKTTPSITIGFAKPKMGQQLLSIEPLAGLEMPMRIAIRELSNGKVKVIYYKPSEVFASYKNPKLDKLGKKMDKMVGMFVAAGRGN